MHSHTPDASAVTGRTAVLDNASTRWLTALDRLERTTVADPAIRVLQRGIHALPLGGMRDLLRGRPLGHPLHPVLVQVPIGCWLSSAVLDLVPGTQRASKTLTAVGLAGIAPAAVAAGSTGRTCLPNRPGSAWPTRPRTRLRWPATPCP